MCEPVHGPGGKPRAPAAPHAPRPIPGSGAPVAPAPARRPPALRAPTPLPPTPDRPLTPGERGPAAPSRACPSRLAQRRGLRGPSIAQAPRRSLVLSFSVCSLAGCARPRSHTARLTLSASHSAADAGAADARIYKAGRQHDVDARRPASSAQPIRTDGHLKGRCRDRSVCVGPAGWRWHPRLLRGRFCLGRFCASCLA